MPYLPNVFGGAPASGEAAGRLAGGVSRSAVLAVSGGAASLGRRSAWLPLGWLGGAATCWGAVASVPGVGVCLTTDRGGGRVSLRAACGGFGGLGSVLGTPGENVLGTVGSDVLGTAGGGVVGTVGSGVLGTLRGIGNCGITVVCRAGASTRAGVSDGRDVGVVGSAVGCNGGAWYGTTGSVGVRSGSATGGVGVGSGRAAVATAGTATGLFCPALFGPGLF